MGLHSGDPLVAGINIKSDVDFVFFILGLNFIADLAVDRLAVFNFEINNNVKVDNFIGFFLSGALPASFVPTIVIILERASLVLLMASDTMEIEFARSPTVALKPAKIILDTMLIMLVLTTIFSRVVLCMQ